MNFSLAAQREVLPMMQKVPVKYLIHIAQEMGEDLIAEKLDQALYEGWFTYRKWFLYHKMGSQLVVLSDGYNSKYAADYYTSPWGTTWKRESYMWTAPDKVLEAFDIPDAAYMPYRMTEKSLKKLYELITGKPRWLPQSLPQAVKWVNQLGLEATIMGVEDLKNYSEGQELLERDSKLKYPDIDERDKFLVVTNDIGELAIFHRVTRHVDGWRVGYAPERCMQGIRQDDYMSMYNIEFEEFENIINQMKGAN